MIEENKNYPYTKVYYDGSHYIGIPKNNFPHGKSCKRKKKQIYYTEFKILVVDDINALCHREAITNYVNKLMTLRFKRMNINKHSFKL